MDKPKRSAYELQAIVRFQLASDRTSVSPSDFKIVFTKLVNLVFGVIGGWVAGAFAGVYYSSAIRQAFEYQEGWYHEYASFLLIPVVVFFTYLYLLRILSSKPLSPPPRWGGAILLLAITVAIYLLARNFIPLSTKFGWIEFTSFWTTVSEVVAMSLCLTLQLVLFVHDRLGL